MPPFLQCSVDDTAKVEERRRIFFVLSDFVDLMFIGHDPELKLCRLLLRPRSSYGGVYVELLPSKVWKDLTDKDLRTVWHVPFISYSSTALRGLISDSFRHIALD